ncbi:MAG: glycosyltransferase family 2 protein [Candidatus Roizmanbacteria bacterium]
MNDQLAIIVTVYNNYAVLEDFFSTLSKQTNINFHIFISDASPQKQKIETNLPFSLYSIENKGYSHGVNEGIREARIKGYEKFCIVNNDILFDIHFVENMINSINIHPTSLIGGKIFYAPQYEYHKGSYKNVEQGHIIWYAGGTIDWNHVTTHHIGVDLLDSEKYSQGQSTEFITGCLMGYDINVFNKVGEWDESYFLYYEDTDYSVRAKKQGVSLIYDPSIVIWHKNAQSTDGSGSLIHQKYQKQNRFRFGMKYAPLKTKLHLIKNYLLNTNY